MAATSDPTAPDGRGARPRATPSKAAPAVAVVAVVAAALLGWTLAGQPADSTAVVPPDCPASVAMDDAAPGPGYQTGVAEQLVPMQLPEPRGPVSARVCRFAEHGGRYELARSVVVEPVATAALAALMNEPVAGPLRGGSSTCPAGPGPDVVIFRYKEGPPVRVDVLGGDSAHVRTAARTEFGRQDVVLAVDRLVCPAG